MNPHSASPPRRIAVRVPRFFWLLTLALLIGAFLRLWQIGSLPPGLHYDEAADTIIAQQIARGESAPIFVAAYTGKEVLFFYWAALWMKLIGPSVFAMRLAAALLGVLTVAVTYRVVVEMFASGSLSPARKKQEAAYKMVALLTTLFIATSFWHVLMSRLGFRSIGEPFIQALALAALFRGLRLNRWRWIAVGGALIGLNLYTYLAARLFPVAITAIFFLPRRIRSRPASLAIGAVSGRGAGRACRLRTAGCVLPRPSQCFPDAHSAGGSARRSGSGFG